MLSVLVQKEVAERLAAPPGTPACGAISVKVAYHATAAVVGVVPPTVFMPRPKVDSAIVRFERRAAPPVDVPSPDRAVHPGPGGLRPAPQDAPPGAAARARAPARTRSLAAAGIPGLTRAEALTLDQWAALARADGPGAVSRDVRVIARAKLTLSLRVLGVRPDGYHELEALVVSLREPHDVVGLRIQAPFGVRVRLSGRAVAGVPVDETNLAARAARLLLDAAADGEDPGPGRRRGSTSRSTRRSPPGPASAAARPTPPAPSSAAPASSASAPIPPRWRPSAPRSVPTSRSVSPAARPGCGAGASSSNRSRRGRLRRPDTDGGVALVVAVPPFGLATPAVYRAWDELGGPSSTRAVPTPGTLAGLGLPGELVNDLEPAAEHLEPRLRPFREALEALAGVPALLAGSGSAYVVPVASTAQAAVVATQAGVELRATAFATGLAARGVEAQTGPD